MKMFVDISKVLLILLCLPYNFQAIAETESTHSDDGMKCNKWCRMTTTLNYIGDKDSYYYIIRGGYHYKSPSTMKDVKFKCSCKWPLHCLQIDGVRRTLLVSFDTFNLDKNSRGVELRMEDGWGENIFLTPCEESSTNSYPCQDGHILGEWINTKSATVMLILHSAKQYDHQQLSFRAICAAIENSSWQWTFLAVPLAVLLCLLIPLFIYCCKPHCRRETTCTATTAQFPPQYDIARELNNMNASALASNVNMQYLPKYEDIQTETPPPPYDMDSDNNQSMAT